MDYDTTALFSEAMMLKLDENKRHLQELAKTDPHIADLVRMDGLPGRADLKMKALPLASAKKALE